MTASSLPPPRPLSACTSSPRGDNLDQAHDALHANLADWKSIPPSHLGPLLWHTPSCLLTRPTRDPDRVHDYAVYIYARILLAVKIRAASETRSSVSATAAACTSTAPPPLTPLKTPVVSMLPGAQAPPTLPPESLTRNEELVPLKVTSFAGCYCRIEVLEPRSRTKPRGNQIPEHVLLQVQQHQSHGAGYRPAESRELGRSGSGETWKLKGRIWFANVLGVHRFGRGLYVRWRSQEGVEELEMEFPDECADDDVEGCERVLRECLEDSEELRPEDKEDEEEERWWDMKRELLGSWVWVDGRTVPEEKLEDRGSKLV